MIIDPNIFCISWYRTMMTDVQYYFSNSYISCTRGLTSCTFKNFRSLRGECERARTWTHVLWLMSCLKFVRTSPLGEFRLRLKLSIQWVGWSLCVCKVLKRPQLSTIPSIQNTSEHYVETHERPANAPCSCTASLRGNKQTRRRPCFHR